MVNDYYHLDQKYREFFEMHFLAGLLMSVLYVVFYFYNIEPHLLTTFNYMIAFDLIMAIVFYKKLFKNNLTFVIFFSVVVESLLWSIYPRLADYSATSSLCYIAGIIVLAFHLQHTNIKYCLIHFIIISTNNYFLEDQNLVIVTFLHIFITTVSSIQSITFKENANQIWHKKELHKNILNLKSYFTHNLLNPINNMLAMISSGLNDRDKIKNSLRVNSSRIEDFLKKEFDDVDHLLDHQVDIFNVPIFNNFKKSSIIVILSMSLFYTFFAVDLFKPISNISYSGLAIVLNFLLFAFHLYKTTNHFSIQKISYIYLFNAQLLFTLKFYLNSNSPIALPLLLSSYLFTIVLAANTRVKYIYSLTLTACLLSLAINDIVDSILFISFIVYFSKVVIGFFHKQESIYKSIKKLVKQETSMMFSQEIEAKLLPLFQKLQDSIDHYLYNEELENDTEEVIESAHNFTEVIHLLNNNDHIKRTHKSL
ncbi:hypothetical protein [Bacteriovorax sp. BAL6_X]|uniref:hypothetical protein n=1 Tax=Bacteriovorax sp. BAL6_X TaxID=1201290 RepID=UPI0012ED21B7|nr:hypothetical protein [Bacteriovorax sp. BAL6_X]